MIKIKLPYDIKPYGNSMLNIVRHYIDTTPRSYITVKMVTKILKSNGKSTSDAYISQMFYKMINVDKTLIKSTKRDDCGNKIHFIKSKIKKLEPKVETDLDTSLIKGIFDLKKTVKEQKIIISSLLKAIEHKDNTLNEIKRIMNNG